MKLISPVFSIIIVNFNGRKYLTECLNSVFANNYKNFEVIVVDNGSSDGTVEFLKKKYQQKINVIGLDKNYGPARARNEGVTFAKGKYIGFLDNDTKVDEDWILQALKLFKSDEQIGILQCKLLLMDSKNFDYAGEYLTNLGFLTQVAKHGDVDHGQYDQIGEILAAKSAGMFIRKDVFLKIGGFDEEYFIFLEETDLGWRCWLADYKVVFCPQSIVYHYFSATKNIVNKNFNNYLIRFHGTKNYIMTLVKNLSSRELLFILPKHILIWLSFSFYLMIRGNFRPAFNVLKGIGWNIIALPKTLSKRKNIQSKRVISDNFLLAIIMKKKNLLEKIKQFFMAEKEIKTTKNGL